MTRSLDEAANLARALAFYDALLNRRDFAAAATHVGSAYRQHNPEVGDGFAATCDFIAGLAQAFPAFRVEVRRALADGDLVMLHARSFDGPTPHGEALADIFRFEGGLIVEHWDVIQPIPAASANANGIV